MENYFLIISKTFNVEQVQHAITSTNYEELDRPVITLSETPSNYLLSGDITTEQRVILFKNLADLGLRHEGRGSRIF